MADRQLAEILESGELDNIQLGSVNSEDQVAKVFQITEVKTAYTNISPSLVTTSTLADQQPIALDTPIRVSFGSASSNSDVSVNSIGTFTMNVAGFFYFDGLFHFGRTGGAGRSLICARMLLNDVQLGSTISGFLDDDDVRLSIQTHFEFNFAINDTIKIELVRDSASSGGNSGGLFTIVHNTIGWADSPCASMTITKKG